MARPRFPRFAPRWLNGFARICAAWAGGGLVALTCAAANLDWHQAGGYRWADLPVPKSGETGFTLLDSAVTGITFTNHLAEASVALNRHWENGSGVALGDVDRDGWCDIYFCRLEGPNVLYRNRGNWQFEDVTEAAGVACPNQHSTGAVFADIDGDGDLDLLVNALGGGTRCFLNDGRGRFAEATNSGLAHKAGSMSMALADIDGDGDLDLYVANYRPDTYQDTPPGLTVEAKAVEGRVVVTPEDRFIPLTSQAGGVRVMERGEPDSLYRNDGRGRFTPLSWTDGTFRNADGQPLTATPTDWGLSVMFRDLNDDGAPDIYVCNDFFFFPDRVWINDGAGRFQAIARYALRNQSLSSMGVDFADINRDGFDDFLVTDMLSRNHSWRHRQRPNMMQGVMLQNLENPSFRPEVPRNTLCLNRGDGTYAEIAQLSGVEATEWSWGAVFLDVDLDGYEDMLIPTGHNHDVQDADMLRLHARSGRPNTLETRLREWPDFPVLATPILAYRNNHDLSFTEVSTRWGFTNASTWQGMALADLDNDGDLDLVVNRLNAAAGVFRNNASTPRIALRLKGAKPNTRGIGARIKMMGGPVPQSQEMISGGRYLSSDDNVRVFAAGTTTNELTMEVAWRSGQQSVVTGVKANRIYEIDEANAKPNPRPKHAATKPRWFDDVSPLLGHTHRNDPVNDFDTQPQLSRKLSSLGPGVAWCDLDGDGWDDLVIGGGRGGAPAAFRNDGRGGFTALTNAVFATLGHATTVLGWTHNPRQTQMLLGVGTGGGKRRLGQSRYST